MNVIIEVLIGVWMFIGVIYAMFTVEKWTPKPKNVGDLIIRLLFLPHSILIYVIVGIAYALDKMIKPIINSKWWNKPL